MLNWAIKTSHLSIGDVAKKLHKDESDINKWLLGEQSPTYPQLESLAYEVLKRPLAIFFMEAPPEEEIKKSFRTLPEAEYEKLTINFIKVLRKAKSMQFKLADICRGKNPASILAFKEIKINNADELLNAVVDIRKVLNVELSEQCKWENSEIALEKWRFVLETKGIFVFKDAFHDDNISGFCLYDNEFPIIYINNSLSKNRQIFTLFHELAHLFLGIGGVDFVINRFIESLNNEDKKIEVVCNKFAGEFLVPSKDFINVIQQYQEFNESIFEKLAKYFCVSKEVILRKLLDLNRVDQETYDELSKKWNEEAKKARKKSKESGGGDYYATQISYLGKNYLDLVFKEYYRNYIDKYQLADFLNMKIESILNLDSVLHK